MEKLKLIITVLFAVVMANSSFAQTHNHVHVSRIKSETIKVLGNCESCQERIEKAAKIEGVLKASWNMKTQLLTLVYDSSKVSSDELQKKIAAVGHDTQKYKADNKVYNSLPGCCKYKRL